MGTFSKRFDSLADEIITSCDFMTIDMQKRVHAERVMWDTGSNTTIISSRLAKQLGGEVFGRGAMDGIGGSSEGNTYLLHVLLPIGDTMAYYEIIESDYGDYDAIIGMDIITKGDFHLDSIKGETVFTFTLP